MTEPPPITSANALKCLQEKAPLREKQINDIESKSKTTMPRHYCPDCGDTYGPDKVWCPLCGCEIEREPEKAAPPESPPTSTPSESPPMGVKKIIQLIACLLGRHEWKEVSRQVNGIGFLDECQKCGRGRGMNWLGMLSHPVNMTRKQMKEWRAEAESEQAR